MKTTRKGLTISKSYNCQIRESLFLMCGSVNSPRGYCFYYFMLPFTELCTLYHKSEILQKFKEFKVLVVKHLGKCISKAAL